MAIENIHSSDKGPDSIYSLHALWPEGLADDPTSIEILLLGLIKTRIGKGDHSYERQAEMGALFWRGGSPLRRETINYHLRKLEAKRFIQQKPRGRNNGGRSSNSVHLLWHDKYERFCKRKWKVASGFETGDVITRPYETFYKGHLPNGNFGPWPADRIPIDFLSLDPGAVMVYSVLTGKSSEQVRQTERRNTIAKKLRISKDRVTRYYTYLAGKGLIRRWASKKDLEIKAAKLINGIVNGTAGEYALRALINELVDREQAPRRFSTEEEHNHIQSVLRELNEVADLYYPWMYGDPWSHDEDQDEELYLDEEEEMCSVAGV